MLGKIEFNSEKCTYDYTIEGGVLQDAAKKLSEFVARTDEKVILELLAKSDRGTLIRLYRIISELLESALLEDKLRAFCEGLEMENIDKLLSGTPADFRLVGQVMAQRIKDVASGNQLAAVSKVRQNTSSNSDYTAALWKALSDKDVKKAGCGSGVWLPLTKKRLNAAINKLHCFYRRSVGCNLR